jgi:hypothetical protein
MSFELSSTVAQILSYPRYTKTRSAEDVSIRQRKWGSSPGEQVQNTTGSLKDLIRIFDRKLSSGRGSILQ